MCSNNTTHNGWTNYETWLVALWLGNDQVTSHYWYEEVERLKMEGGESETANCKKRDLAEALVFNLANQLKKEIEDQSPLIEASLYGDLLTSAMQLVSWKEIARNLLDNE